MKKQETGKKRPVWVFLLIGLIVVAAATVLLLINPWDKDDTAKTNDNKLYWNVEKYIYSAKDQFRGMRDEYYYIRFAVDGEQRDFKVADPLLVEYIDTLEVMGLVFDENEVVVDVLRVEQMGMQIVAEDDYVQSFTDDTLICNSVGNGKGLEKTLQMTEATKIYSVDEEGTLLCGLTGTLQEKSRILAIADESGALTHVYAVAPFVVGDVYWNTARMYDNSTKLSTRQVDELGRFVFTFALNGEHVTLYTRDQEVANKIDGVAAKCMGLTFDEDGYITDVLATKKVTGGSSWGSWYHLLSIDGNTISGKKFSSTNAGSTARGTLAADCKIYDVSGKGAYIGEPTQLRLYDQVHGLKNEFGEISILFVVSRTYEADIYYNVKRQYDSATKTTKRTPAADGYYYIELTHDGQQVTLKTNNKDIVNSIDATAVRCFGLKVEGDEILDFYSAGMVWGGRQFCSYDVVTEISEDGTITAEEVDVEKKGQQTYIGKMAADCGVYNVSSTADTVGEKTTLQVGDKIHALKNLDGEVTYIFVVGRSYNVPIYWNVDRQYDSTNKTTKRTPNTDGYYEIVLAVNGQQKTFKTKSKTLITQIDAVATKCFGLVTNGDIITKLYKTANVNGGTQFCSWDYVTSIKGNTVVAEEPDGSETYSDYMTANTKVYNVTGNGEFIGEKTKLQVGDKIHALKYATGGINIIYVIERQEKVVEEKAYCQLCKKDVTWYSWDGERAFEDGKHYYLNQSLGLSQTAYIGSAENANMEVTLDLRGYDIRAAVRAFRIYGTLNLLDSKGDGVIYGNATGQATGFYVYDAGTFNLYGGHFVGGKNPNTQCGIGAVGLDKGSNATFNMYGGSLTGGNTNKDGGNLSLYHSAVFNMYGGSISGGKTLDRGGNIEADAKAKINLYGGSITGGKAATGNCIYGGQVAIYNSAAVVVDNIYLSTALNVPDALAAGSKVTVTLPSGSGAVTGQTPETNLQYIHATNGEILWQGGKLMIMGKPDKTAYCDHCQKDVDWYIWDGKYALESGLHYYLNDNVTVEATAYIGSAENTDVTVCLDLNGKNIDATVRVFRVYGNLNLMDSAEIDGTITGNTTGQASVFYVYENAVFNLYGGKLTSVTTVTSDYGAGIGGVDKGIMNMYSGTITGGTAKKSGGNLNLYNTGVLNLYGGTIKNGTSQEGSGGNIQLSPKSQLHIYGGSILGGSAGNLGNCINANGAVTLHSKDIITVTEIYLPGTKTLILEGQLAGNSSIGILLEKETGSFTGNTVEANADFFNHETYEIFWADNKLMLGQKPVVPTWCEHCQQEVTWQAWDGVTAFENGGHYYLSDSVTVAATAYIGTADSKDMTVCFDLNGKNIDSTVRVFRVYGNLNLMDSAEVDGTITGNTAGQASVFYVYEDAVFNMYGGKLTSAKTVTSSSGAGIGGIDKGTMNMYGGLITGGTAKKSGGNLNVYNTGVLNMYGGTIENGTSQEGSGGNIQLSSSSQLHIYGGSILGGSAGNLGDCINANGAVTLRSKDIITVTEIYLPGTKTLTLDGQLADNSAIGILTEKGAGAFTTDTLEANAKFFNSDDYDVLWRDNKLTLKTKEQPPEDPNAHWHCICGGLGDKGDHMDCTKVVWTAWPGVDNLVLDGSVYYYLTESITVEQSIKLEEGQTLNLCLNGNSITTEASIYIFDIYGTLRLCDHPDENGEYSGAVTNLCSGTGKGYHSRVFYLRGTETGSEFCLYGGNISAPNAKATGTGGTVARVGSSTGTSTFKMYAGKIFGGKASASGIAGNVVLEKGSTTWLYGGLITGGSNDKGAGNVILKNGAALTVDGGSITAGNGTDGGNVYVSSGCTLSVLSGFITGGTASGNGADIYAAGTVTVDPEATVDHIYTP